MSKTSPGKRKTYVPAKRLAAIFRMSSRGKRRRRKPAFTPKPTFKPKVTFKPRFRRKPRYPRPKR